ncbi:radical SAM protein [Dehalogenimonas sp. 4OHTPN]|uniref:Radical SAM protein n=1 Tax=Dehalogenimonas sp. 4OHTPN TaxID=3166643 RepID=A0AAU8GCH6_9CHLR
MRIALIIPSRAYHGTPGYADFPDELLSVAGTLERSGHQITCADYNVNPDPDHDKIAAFNPGIAVFYVGTGPEIADAAARSQSLKKAIVNVKIVWIGCHPTVFPNQTLHEEFVDFIVIGCAEKPVNELASCIEQGKDFSAIRGLGFKGTSAATAVNPPDANIDPDGLPDPAWHLADVRRYPDVNLNTARGGLYACTFFSDSAGDAGKTVTPSRLARQMQDLARNHGVKSVYLSGVGLTGNPDNLRRFCQALIGLGLKLPWRLPVSRELDDETARLMAKAGCTSVLLDVGSGSPRLRDFIGKGDISAVERTFHRLVRRRIVPTLYVNYDYPGETEPDFKATLDLIRRLDYPPCLLLKFIPYPGTDLYEYCRRESLIQIPETLESWSDFAADCMRRSFSQVSRELLNSTLANYRKSYAARRVRFMLRHNPVYFISVISRPREFYRRLKELVSYWLGIVSEKRKSG